MSIRYVLYPINIDKNIRMRKERLQAMKWKVLALFCVLPDNEVIDVLVPQVRIH